MASIADNRLLGEYCNNKFKKSMDSGGVFDLKTYFIICVSVYYKLA
jgi:hypothetical protein